MPFDYTRIQQQFHASKRRTSPIAARAGPFTCYLNPNNDAHHDNYAIPNIAHPEREPGGIPDLLAVFRFHNRRPRLEYIEACAPGLEAALHRCGFQTETRAVLFLCTTESLVRPEQVPGVELSLLGPDGDLETYRQFKTVEFRCFWREYAPEATLTEAEEFRLRFGDLPKVIARSAGRVVGVGVLTYAHGGIAEEAGIATLPDFRRRGIAGLVTARLAEFAFESGLETVFLTAADEDAGRVYARAGFFPSGTCQINISVPAE